MWTLGSQLRCFRPARDRKPWLKLPRISNPLTKAPAAPESSAWLGVISPADWDAYDNYLQGRAHFHRYELDESEPLFARSVELDSTFAQGHAFLAQALVGRFWYDNDPRTLQKAWDSARTALALDRSDGVCHQSMGLVLTHMRQHSDAGVHFEQARSLNPLV